MRQARTSDPLVSPVDAEDLADWLGVDDTDTLLDPLLLSATDAVVNHLGLDLLAREWTYTLWDWPAVGTPTSPSLSRQASYLDRDVRLPYANLLTLESVTSYGAEVADVIPRNDSIILPRNVERYAYQLNEDPALEVVYSAGYGNAADDVPEGVKSAIKVMAAYMYEHRGECDATDAMRKSGARELLAPYVHPSNVVVW